MEKMALRQLDPDRAARLRTELEKGKGLPEACEAVDLGKHCEGIPRTGMPPGGEAPLNPGPKPSPGLTPAPTTPEPTNHDSDKYKAGQAFVSAYASLQQAKRNGATGKALQPFVSVCLASQDNARAWGVEVDQWDCSDTTPLPQPTPPGPSKPPVKPPVYNGQ